MGPWADGAGTFPSRFAANMVDVLNFTYRELKSDQVQQLSSLSQLKSARRDYAVTYTDIRRLRTQAASSKQPITCREEGVWERAIHRCALHTNPSHNRADLPLGIIVWTFQDQRR